MDNKWIDKQDQQLSFFSIMRKYAKGYRKIFFYLMDLSAFNSYVLLEKVTNKKMHFTDFRMKLAEQNLESSTLFDYFRKGRPCQGVSPLRLQGSGHFVKAILPTPKQKPQKRCARQRIRRVKIDMNVKNVLLHCTFWTAEIYHKRKNFLIFT